MRTSLFLALLLAVVLACDGGADEDAPSAVTAAGSPSPVATAAAAGATATASTATASPAAATSTPGTSEAVSEELRLRDFVLPLPLFAPDSAWNQRVTDAAVLPESDEQMLALYRVLLGDDSTLDTKGLFPDPFPFVWLNLDEFTVPIFAAGGEQQSVLICDYDGEFGWTNPKLPSGLEWDEGGGRVTVPAPSTPIRPSGPETRDADGHLVLFDAATLTEYDYWQATTVGDGECGSRGGGLAGTTVLETGMLDFFDVRGAGTNPLGYFSARAAGVPLLAGLIVPEDIERGAIEHALVFAIPGVRSVRGAVEPPDPRDIVYPASQIEPDFFNTNPRALAHGQRIRLKQTIVDSEGNLVDESTLAPITRIFLGALRTYGAYLVDNAGGFVFSAEDIHTANLRLSDAETNVLAGLPPGTPLPEDKTRWQVVMEKLLGELYQLPGHEDGLPLASDGAQPWWAYESDEHDPAEATFGVSNFEVVEPAAIAASDASP